MSVSGTMFNERVSEIRRCKTHALYRSKFNDNRTIASTHKMQIRTVQRLRAQFNASDDPLDGYSYGLWCGFKGGSHHATSHLRSRFESQHQNVPGCAEECGNLLVQSGDWWQTLSVTSGLGFGLQVQRDPGLALEGVLRLCTLLSLAPFLLRSEPARLLHLDIRRKYHKYDLPQHQSQPNIRRAPPGAFGKGMLRVPDPYRGGD